MKAKGVDVSHHQGLNIDWQKLRDDDGISFAFLRATVGQRKDSTYLRNYRCAGEAGILRGAYHYFYPQFDAKQQAQLFAATVLESELPLALDVEHAGMTEAHVRAFLDELERITGRPAMIYTSMSKWHALIGTNTPWVGERELWVAHYTNAPEPLLPRAWQKWTFWQFTESGQVSGHHGAIDMDYFNGDESALVAYAGATPPPPPDETDGFDFPCGRPDGEGYYVAAGLAEDEYYNRFGAWHTGEDWNGLGYGNTDLGDPVYAIANGTVVASDYFAPSWGNIVLIEHKMPNGDKVWSQYAHLQKRTIAQGDKITRGQQIGTIGRGYNDAYYAHLHFEIRLRDLEPDAWGSSRDKVLNWYAHPTEFIKAHRPGFVSVEVTMDKDSEGFVRSESRYWYDSPVGYGGQSYWTYTMKSKEDCWAKWQPKLPQSGLYEVMAFIPAKNATSKQARYEITHRRGTAAAIIDQSRYFDQWVSLGRYPFSIAPSMPAVVRLSDKTGEPFTSKKSTRKQIAFDAIRFILVEKALED